MTPTEHVTKTTEILNISATTNIFLKSPQYFSKEHSLTCIKLFKIFFSKISQMYGIMLLNFMVILMKRGMGKTKLFLKQTKETKLEDACPKRHAIFHIYTCFQKIIFFIEFKYCENFENNYLQRDLSYFCKMVHQYKKRYQQIAIIPFLLGNF